MSDASRREEISRQLADAGVRLGEIGEIPAMTIVLDEATGRPRPVWEEVPIVSASPEEPVRFLALPEVAELYAGSRVPPDLSGEPPDEYDGICLSLERTVVDYCVASGRAESDRELHRIYRRLRRHPDGRDRNPLASYIRAAARLYMALAPISRHEYDAVLARLAKSARTFSIGPASTNYLQTVGPAVRPS